MLGDDLYELVAVPQQRPRQAAIHVAFDPSEELLWSATDQVSTEHATQEAAAWLDVQ
jgi:hypothetical protein